MQIYPKLGKNPMEHCTNRAEHSTPVPKVWIEPLVDLWKQCLWFLKAEVDQSVIKGLAITGDRIECSVDVTIRTATMVLNGKADSREWVACSSP